MSIPSKGRDQQFRRNENFHTSRRLLRHDPALPLDRSNVTGPLSFLNPTRAHFQHAIQPTQSAGPLAGVSKSEGIPGISYKWTSRNNRKGRHALVVRRHIASSQKHTIPARSTSWKQIALGIWRMLTKYPIWDISYDVATIFTFGSVIWVINAFFVWLPMVRPDTEFNNEVLYGGGITAFIGATIFEIGSILLLAEAVNENRTGCFGWALERAFSKDVEASTAQTVHLRPAKSSCTHHHLDKNNLIGTENTPELNSRSWTWLPTRTELLTHYVHELGFLASLTQLLAASIFWISGLTALPGIYNHMSRPVTIIFYWVPQVIGGAGFILSGALFMLETQSRWYKPAFRTLGWWIGAWNLVGGIGFTVCPAFGLDESSWAQYQAGLSTFWGSWAFLVGSVVQWYESLGKFPVEVRKVRG